MSYDEINSNDNNVNVMKYDPYFKKYRNEIYTDLAENPSALFNFFLENNSVAKKISDEDEKYLIDTFNNYNKTRKNIFIFSYISIFTIDQIILRFLYPKYRVDGFRITINLFKYAFLPLTLYTLIKNKYLLDLEEVYLDTALKYKFSIDDFNEIFDIYEKEKLSDNLDEIIQQRNSYLSKKIIK